VSATASPSEDQRTVICKFLTERPQAKMIYYICQYGTLDLPKARNLEEIRFLATRALEIV
jgi:hypothetical protein